MYCMPKSGAAEGLLFSVRFGLLVILDLVWAPIYSDVQDQILSYAPSSIDLPSNNLGSARLWLQKMTRTSWCIELV